MISTPQGYRVQHYRLSLPLPAPLQARISALRNELHERQGLPAAFESRPALTLARFAAYERVAARLEERLGEVAMAVPSFAVAVNGFHSCPPHSIFMGVDGQPSFSELARELATLSWLMNVPGQEPQFLTEPQLLMAQKLKPMKFISMWMELEHRPFSASFEAEGLQLCKRQEGSGRFETVRTYALLPAARTLRQGDLFSSC